MNQEQVDQLKQTLGPLRIREGEQLSKHTYFKIGGPARLFFEAKSVDDLKLVLTCTHQYQISFIVLGGGANVLVSDRGFDGLVIKNQASEIKLVGVKGTIDKSGTGIKSALVWASSGTLMNQLARFTIDQGLEGLEFLLSVPGTIGGGLKINAHFEVERGEFIGDRLASAALFDPKTGEIRTFDNKYFEFSYDHSKIQETNEIVLEAIFRLERTLDPTVLWQRSMENVKRRNQEQPIGIACSGCIFRNITDEDAKRLATPNLTTSTGYIIDKLGLKGIKVGNAQISEHHANFIINTGEATAQEVLKLINLIKDKAKEQFNLDLKEEIFYVGEF